MMQKNMSSIISKKINNNKIDINESSELLINAKKNK